MASRQSLAARAGGRRGVTLIELIIVVAIVGILAALAIPVISGYIRDARLTEATTNIQGILEAEEAYFARYQRYTSPLPECPLPPADWKNRQVWLVTACDPGWQQLGFGPEGPVFFVYSVFSHYDPTAVPEDLSVAPAMANSNLFGIDWAAEGFGANVQPWCAVQARADTDGDGQFVFFRGNSYNKKTHRSPNKLTGGLETW